MGQKGITLVELLVAMVVASIIGIAVINMFTISNRTFMDQNKVIDVQRDGRLLVDYVSKALRAAGLNPFNNPDFQGIRDRSLYGIRIDSDLNINNSLDPAEEIISFQYDFVDGILQRGFNEGPGNIRWQTIASNIENFEFEYYDGVNASPNAGLAPENIKAIGVSVRFNDERFMGGDITRTYRTRIDLRNR